MDGYRNPESYVVIGPGQIYRMRKNLQEYDKLKKYFSGPLAKYLIEAPASFPDDHMIIQTAFELDLMILTNDRFVDHKRDHPEIAEELESSWSSTKWSMAN